MQLLWDIQSFAAPKQPSVLLWPRRESVQYDIHMAHESIALRIFPAFSASAPWRSRSSPTGRKGAAYASKSYGGFRSFCKEKLICPVLISLVMLEFGLLLLWVLWRCFQSPLVCLPKRDKYNVRPATNVQMPYIPWLCRRPTTYTFLPLCFPKSLNGCMVRSLLSHSAFNEMKHRYHIWHIL
jgi:hypothetical protein